MCAPSPDESDNELSTYSPSSNPKEDIKAPLERILPPLLYDLLGPDPYSWYAATMLMCSHVDLLGHLRSGGCSRRDQARCAVGFIRDYLGRIDSKYEQIGGLLYFVLRHGLIHKGQPKRIQLDDGMTLGIKFSDTDKREKHLIVTEEWGERRLKVSVRLLYEDLLSAIDLYCDDMSRDAKLSNAYRWAWKKLGEAESETKVRRSARAYIKDSDLDFLKRQC